MHLAKRFKDTTIDIVNISTSNNATICVQIRDRQVSERNFHTRVFTRVYNKIPLNVT